MRVLKVPENGPKRNLLDAAELLVSEKGFDLVSVRDVTGAVNANVAAVNYHFGSREGLMDLLMMRLLAPLCEERISALEKAERKHAGKIVRLEEIVSSFAGALGTTANRMGMEEAYFLKLVGRILVLPDEALAPALLILRENVRERFLAAIARSVPDSSADEIAASWRIFDSGLSQSLVTTTPAEDLTALMAHWIQFGTKGLGGGTAAKAPKKDDSQGMLFDF